MYEYSVAPNFNNEGEWQADSVQGILFYTVRKVFGDFAVQYVSDDATVLQSSMWRKV